MEVKDRVNRNELPEYIKEIGGVPVKEFRPVLGDSIREYEMEKVDIRKAMLKGALNLSYRENVRKKLSGYGEDVISSGIGWIYEKGLDLIEEGRYADGMRMIEFVHGQIMPKEDGKGMGGMVNINIATEGMMAKVEEIRRMQAEEDKRNGC